MRTGNAGRRGRAPRARGASDPTRVTEESQRPAGPGLPTSSGGATERRRPRTRRGRRAGTDSARGATSSARGRGPDGRCGTIGSRRAYQRSATSTTGYMVRSRSMTAVSSSHRAPVGSARSWRSFSCVPTRPCRGDAGRGALGRVAATERDEDPPELRLEAPARAGGSGRLLTRGHGYELRVEPGELDIDRFGELLEAGRRATAERAARGGDVARGARTLARAGPGRLRRRARREVGGLGRIRPPSLEDGAAGDLRALTRIEPATLRIVSDIPSGLAVGFGAVWVTVGSQNAVLADPSAH